uniref:APM1 n=1 Tax=Arundo donax TaxID=35708 RepID=A0A0A9GQS0_ARUDO
MEVVFFADDEILVLRFAKELPLGEGVLSMKFNGTLNDQMRGFYRRYWFPILEQLFCHLHFHWMVLKRGT